MSVFHCFGYAFVIFPYVILLIDKEWYDTRCNLINKEKSNPNETSFERLAIELEEVQLQPYHLFVL